MCVQGICVGMCGGVSLVNVVCVCANAVCSVFYASIFFLCLMRV